MEEENIAVWRRLEPVDLLIVGHAADLNRSIPKPQRVTGDRRVEGY